MQGWPLGSKSIMNKVRSTQRGEKALGRVSTKARYDAMNGMIWTFFEKDKRFGMLALSIGSPARSRHRQDIVMPLEDVVKDLSIGIG